MRIDDDLLGELRERAERGKVPLTRVLNDVLRAGLKSARGAPTRRRRFREETYPLGSPTLDLTKALGIAAALEDEEILRKAMLRK